MWNSFAEHRDELLNQYEVNNWFGGLEQEELKKGAEKTIDENKSSSVMNLKAELIEYILKNARIDIVENEFFFDKIDHANIMPDFKDSRYCEVFSNISEESFNAKRRIKNNKVAHLELDFSHVAPDWDFIIMNGIPGIIERLEDNSRRHGDDGTAEYYDCCIRIYRAFVDYIHRVEELARRISSEKSLFIADNLKQLCVSAPQTLAQAMQLTFLIYSFQMYLDGVGVRSLGGIDHLYYPLYKSDIESGRFSEEQLRELTSDFLWKISAMKTLANLPFYICGTDKSGNDASNPYTMVLLEEYEKLDIYDPKFHVLYHSGISEAVVDKILRLIRSGKSSFVFVNCEATAKALMKLGIEEKDAKRITVYGCYETSAEGTEVPCTCASYISLPKAVELAFNNGHDMKSGELIGVETNVNINTFEDFIKEVKVQLEHLTGSVMDIMRELEGHYPQVCPSLVMSPTYKHSAESGIELYSGGAKYNNTSIIGAGIATLTDAVMAVKKVVFEDKKVTFEQLREILLNDWQGQQRLQNYCRNCCPKYGNNDDETDKISTELFEFFAGLINGQPNGRNGLFRCGLFSVDMRFWLSEGIAATPDGRNRGEVFSKNAAATLGRDKEGVTAYLNSLLKFDSAQIPDGCVADVVLHESAVKGEEGIRAFVGLLKTFMDKGGHSAHFNVLNADKLIEAQKYPEKYKNLQVRLCGWNVRFNDLSKRDQDEFIIKAKMGC